ARAVGDDADRVDRVADFSRAPLTHGIEVLHRQAHRLEHLVAAGAARGGAVQYQALTHGLRGFAGVLVQLRLHSRRRIRWTYAEEGLQEPFAAFHRRRTRRIRRDGQQRTLAQQASAHVLVSPELDPAELRTVDAGNAIVSGETLVDEGVIRRQQIV